ncbi:MAG: putative DNA-binding transcriptional regulator [Candidatus Accumulibacter regalis]|jgi:serine/threonine-protein kinase HipA|uniref:DNA-binding transcriptional regulator n=2 Tax=Candidatus Accumulibacter TaxID=327159 RepID=A0A011QPM0_ACCRE|nr:MULTISPECIES: HipA domain-containing protein [unclassified Candidatus Accumulibacter]EXI78934.1 MAG: putative DNA-binding transcriptional regulator [Candidatus Accumulibacter appositus]EXI91252.1 MAG: putative DNA-binding transcriptional regulator [Candidatus Accumulibacter regalis]HRE70084.1 HipA domain-containing protein [Accumulibacter sp.]HRE86616.1 HipA domain-containing protein [Accumulibacter sp.]
MIARVQLWGRTIGAVSRPEGRDVAAFQYDPEFARSGIEIAPLTMPLNERVYEFPALPREAFHGLPGLLADSLPDRFGNALIDAWLATQGRRPESFNAVQRLCYTGRRGMGALEFMPARGPRGREARPVDVAALVRRASEVLTHRDDLQERFHQAGKAKALRDLLSVGTAAGGARAKAVIAWNPTTSEVRSGPIAAGDGCEYWLLKFDGVSGNKDKELEDPQGYGAIEYAYHLMAKAAGITMSACRLLEENGRRHFMTRRFDRLPGGEKLHMQSLAALAHFDFNHAGATAYEQALLTLHQLRLPMAAVEEQFRRMVFNIVARNQDDHVKNIAFLMNREGEWSLAPAFDLTYSYNPSGAWTATHQMTLNGKRDGFARNDFKACAQAALMKRGRAATIIAEVQAAVQRWPEFAAEARVADERRDAIQTTHRLSFPER